MIDSVTDFIAFFVALRHIDECHREGRDNGMPNDALLVMTGFNQGGDKARDADAIRAHQRMHCVAIASGDGEIHGAAVLVTKVENMPCLNGAFFDDVFAGGFVGIVQFFLARIEF